MVLLIFCWPLTTWPLVISTPDIRILKTSFLIPHVYPNLISWLTCNSILYTHPSVDKQIYITWQKWHEGNSFFHSQYHNLQTAKSVKFMLLWNKLYYTGNSPKYRFFFTGNPIISFKYSPCVYYIFKLLAKDCNIPQIKYFVQIFLKYIIWK